MEIKLTGLSFSEKKVYKKAVKEISKTDRGKQLIQSLQNSESDYTIKINRDGNNSYSPTDKTINWDPNRAMITGDDGELSSSTLLAHEMGHADQDEKGDLILNPTMEQRMNLENQNLQLTENPIARDKNEGVRKDYSDWKYTVENGKLNQINFDYYN